MRTNLSFLSYSYSDVLVSCAFQLSMIHFREVKLLQVNLKKLQAESDKRDGKLYGNMFHRIAKESDVVSKVIFFIF